MQGASLFSNFGGRLTGAAAVSAKLQTARLSFPYTLATRAGEQVAKAGQDPKVDVPDEDSIATGSLPEQRKAYRDDMEESYGIGYATRAADMGYGQMYGEAVKAVLDKKADKMEMQKGATSERDQHADAFVDAEYDTTQGEPVAEKEVGRHAVHSESFEAEKKAHERTEEMGDRGGAPS